MSKYLIILALLGCAIQLSACGAREAKPVTSTYIGPPLFSSIRQATAQDCPGSQEFYQRGYGSVFINGKDYNRDGVNDESEIDSMNYVCNGSTGSKGEKGDEGQDGSEGIQGPKGDTGSVGEKGDTGANGSSFTLYPVTPCRDTISGAYPEVLMCINDKLFAVYDSGVLGKVHYVEVIPGSYVTTDGRSCHFTVTSGCNIQ